MSNNFERDEEIRKLYTDGISIPQLAIRFDLSSPRIWQVLHKAGLNREDRPLGPPTMRTAYIGVTTTVAVKEAVRSAAKDAGKSMSTLISELLAKEFGTADAEILGYLNEEDVPLPLEG